MITVRGSHTGPTAARGLVRHGRDLGRKVFGDVLVWPSCPRGTTGPVGRTPARRSTSPLIGRRPPASASRGSSACGLRATAARVSLRPCPAFAYGARGCPETRLASGAPRSRRGAVQAVGVMTFGGPEALEVVDLPEHHAGPGEVRIRVHAAAVSPTDTYVRNGVR